MAQRFDQRPRHLLLPQRQPLRRRVAQRPQEWPGAYYYASGDKYVGDFANDQTNGQGTYYYSNGNRYEGEWRNGRKNGQGTLYESDRKIVGEWQNDQMTRVRVEQ